MRRVSSLLTTLALAATVLVTTAPVARAEQLNYSGLSVTWSNADMIESDGCKGYQFNWANNSGRRLTFWFYVGWLGYGRAISNFSKLANNGDSGVGTVILCKDKLFNGRGPYDTFLLVMEDAGYSRSVTGVDNFTLQPAVTAPTAPRNVFATAGQGSATVSWLPPDNTGGSPVTGYTVTATPGGMTCTATTTSCTVRGLQNGTSYTFTVTATNSAGTSTASPPSAPVTPQQPISISISCRPGKSGSSAMAACTGMATGIPGGTRIAVQTRALPRGRWTQSASSTWPVLASDGQFSWQRTVAQPSRLAIRFSHQGKLSNTQTVTFR